MATGKNKYCWHHVDLLYNILTSKPNEKNVDFFQRIIKNLSSLRDAPEMVEYIIASYEKSENFSQAEKYVARVDMERAVRFLEQWHSKVDNDEYCIIVCRMALLYRFVYLGRATMGRALMSRWSFSQNLTLLMPLWSSPSFWFCPCRWTQKRAIRKLEFATSSSWVQTPFLKRTMSLTASSFSKWIRLRQG